jgi:DNA-binding MarR family transcriptional regulator
MLLNDPLQHRRAARVIPDALRIHDGDWAAQTDAQAVHLAALHQRTRPGEAQFLEPTFEKFPCLQPRFARAALRLCLIRAEEDVAAVMGETERLGGLFQIIMHGAWIGQGRGAFQPVVRQMRRDYMLTHRQSINKQHRVNTSQQPGPRYAPLIRLLRASEALWNASRVFFDEWELSPSQFNILNLLWEQPDGLTQSDLGRQLIMHRSNVTGLVDRLEQRGLVARKESATDRRAWRVVLSPAGRKLMLRILPRYYAVAEQVWGKRTPAQAETLAGQVTELAANADSIASGLGKKAS